MTFGCLQIKWEAKPIVDEFLLSLEKNKNQKVVI